MASDQDKTLEAVKISIQMEIDGKEYYLKASDASGNELGKNLLQTLAGEEDSHRRRFEEIYKAISGQESWPEADLQSDNVKTLKTVFAKAIERVGSNVKSVATELDTIQTAMGMENKTHDFYEEHAKTATHDVEKVFYETLAVIEREHHMVLADYYEFLKDPAAWFVGKEHPSLDGG